MITMPWSTLNAVCRFIPVQSFHYLGLIIYVGGGSDARRKGRIRQRLSGSILFIEVRKMVKCAQLKATKSFIERAAGEV